MPISFKKKIIYIHNQRTGGYSITKALNLAGCEMDILGNKHMIASEMKKLVPDWDECFKFGFVRNPFDRLVSIFFHRTQNLNSRRYRKYGSFKNFVINCEVYPKDLGLQCDKFDYGFILGRFENFKEDYDKICKLAKIKNCLLERKLNKSVHKNYRKYYTEKTRNIVERIFKKDLETYNYGF